MGLEFYNRISKLNTLIEKREFIIIVTVPAALLKRLEIN